MKRVNKLKINKHDRELVMLYREKQPLFYCGRKVGVASKRLKNEIVKVLRNHVRRLRQMSKIRWVFICCLAFYLSAAFFVFQWRHPNLNEVQGLRHLSTVLIFGKI